MPSVPEMVERVHRMGQPALALTDHGLMTGTHQLIRECQEHDLVPFPGEEFYLVQSAEKEAQRYHLILLALDRQGYETLVRLSSLSHTRERFHRKPRIELADLSRLAESGEADHIALLTGCYGGLVVQSLVHQDEKAARRIIEMFARWVPATYVELQNHLADDRGDGVSDEEVVLALYDIAQEVGVPVICTQDAHYLRMGDRKYHDLMKQLAVPWLSDADAVFQGDSFHLAREDWMAEHFTPEVWEAGLQGAKDLLSRSDLYIEELVKYRYRVPAVVDQPDSELRAMCEEELERRGLGKKYAHRLDEELEVITKLGMADYILLVYDYVAWAKSRGILVQARGSASGSVVCWLLGITQADPIRWGLLFERFLSIDRVRPPDIDLDVEDQHRGEVVDYIRQRFGDVTQIGTFGRLGIDQETGRGSLLVQLLSRRRKDLSPEEYRERYGHVKTVMDLPEAEALIKLSEMKVRKSPGAHAAGYALGTDDLPLTRLVPTMLIPSSGHQVTQILMDDIEEAGFLKVDVLGLRYLSVVGDTLKMIEREGLEWIPLDDELTFKRLRQGRTAGVFQLEGATATRGLRELRPSSIEGIVRIMALYRPATLDSGYTEQYRMTKKAKKVHPVIDRVLRGTRGVVVFQEQVLTILRELGIPAEERNKVLKALKLSNDKAVKAQRIFTEQRERFIELLQESEGEEMAERLWDYIAGFAGYGFNRAHAVAYGLMAYRTAWLKFHVPGPYMVALLSHAPSSKESGYVAEAKRLGLSVAVPDVNTSQAGWTLVGESIIRRGLASIKGVGKKAAEAIVAGQPYQDMSDFIERTPSRLVTGGKSWEKNGELIGVMAKLKEAGALRSLGVGVWE